jgi:hypothetical protein
MDFRAGSQSTGSLFGCDVALGFGQKFKTVRLFDVMSLRQDNTRTRPETFERRRFVIAEEKSGHVDVLCWLPHRHYGYFRPLEACAFDGCP